MFLIVTLLYLSLCAAALWFAAQSCPEDRRHAVQIAVILLLDCAVSNSNWISRNWWEWPVQDAAVAWFVAIRYRLRPTPWKMGIMLVAIGQLSAHTSWQLSDKSPSINWAYTATLNLLFMVRLAFVASSGSKQGCGRIRDYLAGRFDPRRRGVFRLLHRHKATKRKGH